MLPAANGAGNHSCEDYIDPAHAGVQVIGFIYTAVVVVIRGSQIAAERGDFGDVKLFNWSFDALFAIPIVVFGFNCHANVVTIFT